MSFFGKKVKVTIQEDDGTFYELDAMSVSVSRTLELIDTPTYGEENSFIPGFETVEVNFVGTGNVTTGIKKTMVVCVGCGSEWKEDDPYHPGTCANCGWGAGSTKREINV